MRTARTHFFGLATTILIVGCSTTMNSTSGAGREVYIISEGYNAAYGKNIIKITQSSVLIDTSYYPEDFNVTNVDPSHLSKNRQFNCDIKKQVKDKSIYYSLLTTPIDTLMAYQNNSTLIEGHYTIQPITITESGKTFLFEFRIPNVKDVKQTALAKFLFDLGRLFPFNPDNFQYCNQYYGNNSP